MLRHPVEVLLEVMATRSGTRAMHVAYLDAKPMDRSSPPPPPRSPVLVQSGNGPTYYQKYPSVHNFATTPSPKTRSQRAAGPLFADYLMHHTMPIREDPQYHSDHFPYAWRALSFVLFHQQALRHIALRENSIPKRIPESIVDIVSCAAGVSASDSQLTNINRYPNVLSGATKCFQNFTLRQTYELVLPQDEISSAFAFDALKEQTVSRKFKSFMLRLPAFAQDIVISADPEGLVGRMLPSGLVPPGARYIATCFWAWLCVIDDLTEESDSFGSLEQCVVALSRTPYAAPSQDNSDRMRIMNAFHHAVSTTALFSVRRNSNSIVVECWKPHFWREVLRVVKALQAEKSLQGRNFSLREWIDVRQLTISARPFMVLVRASLNLPCNLDYSTDRTGDSRIHRIQTLVQAVLGLQNDLLGWEKDHRTKNPLNAVEVLIRDGMEASDAFSEVLQSHNHLMRILLQVARQLVLLSIEMHNAGFVAHEAYLFATLANLRITVGFGSAMAEWMLSSRRYTSKTDLRTTSEVTTSN